VIFRILLASALISTGVLAHGQELTSQHSLPQSVERSIAHYHIDTDEHPGKQFKEFFELWRAGDRELSVYVYFVGQIRFRTYLMANPDLPKSRDPAAFQSLSYLADTKINQWVHEHGKLKDLVSIIDHALHWHAQSDDVLTTKSAHPTAHKEVREGLLRLRSFYAKQA